jgi:hypothetical protein
MRGGGSAFGGYRGVYHRARIRATRWLIQATLALLPSLRALQRVAGSRRAKLALRGRGPGGAIGKLVDSGIRGATPHP